MVPKTNRHDIVAPDIVIHQSGNTDNNLLAMEIKIATTSAVEFLEDIIKLELYTNPTQGLDFSIGIMLAFNFDAAELVTKAHSETRANIAAAISKGPRTAIWNIPKQSATQMRFVDGTNDSGIH